MSTLGRYKSEVVVTFLPTGTIDMAQTNATELTAATALLQPKIDALRVMANQFNVSLEFWPFINWIFVTHYWLILYDFGQISPTIYNHDFTGDTQYSSANNIFVNDTLFQIYASYLNNTILPLMKEPSPAFLPLTRENSLQPKDVSLRLMYYCTELQIKAPGSLIISVSAADYALITGLYTFGIWVAKNLEAWKEKREAKRPEPRELTHITAVQATARDDFYVEDAPLLDKHKAY